MAGVKYATHLAVLTYEDAALRVLGGVARMDANALPFAIELRTTEQDGQPLPELGRVRDNHRVTPLGNGRPAFDFPAAVSIIAPGGFECITEISLLRASRIL